MPSNLKEGLKRRKDGSRRLQRQKKKLMQALFALYSPFISLLMPSNLPEDLKW